MYAIMETGGIQFKVQEGDKLKIPKLNVEPGKPVTFDKVLLISKDEKQALVGKPYLEGARIEAQVISSGKGEKVLVYKFRRRVKYRRKKGHRQDYTQVLINKIGAPAKSKS